MFIALVKSNDLASLAPHRHRDGWKVAVHGDGTCFLKLPQSAENEEYFAHLPCLKRWTLDDRNRLTPPGKELPDALLPELAWLPLASLLPITSTEIRENEPFFGHLGFSLIESSKEMDPSALLLPFHSFSTWAENAPFPRLSKIKYALCNSGQALITGPPLPPLAGQTFYRNHKLLIPSGYALPSFIRAEDLTRGNDQILLIDPDNTVHTIGSELFLPATRSSIRTTSNSL